MIKVRSLVNLTTSVHALSMKSVPDYLHGLRCRPIVETIALDAAPRLEETALRILGRREVAQDLLRILEHANGFSALDTAIYVFPTRVGHPYDVCTWNDDKTWRSEYGDLSDGLLFFGEDLFGDQFAFRRDGRVVLFDAETGEQEEVASDVVDWLRVIGDEQNRWMSGVVLAVEWNKLHSEVGENDRLCPVRPFVIGGEYEIHNLRAVERTRGMVTRGRLASRIRGLPEGTWVRILGAH